MATIVYDDAMRHDPVRRAAVRARIEERQAAWVRARALVAEAAEALRSLGSVEDDAVLAGSVTAVLSADTRMRRDEPFVMREPTETYVGNLAARGEPVGWVSSLTDLCSLAYRPEDSAPE